VINIEFYWLQLELRGVGCINKTVKLMITTCKVTYTNKYYFYHTGWVKSRYTVIFFLYRYCK